MRVISSTTVKLESSRPTPRKTVENDEPKFIDGFELHHDLGGYYILKPSTASATLVRYSIPHAEGFALESQRNGEPHFITTHE